MYRFVITLLFAFMAGQAMSQDDSGPNHQAWFLSEHGYWEVWVVENYHSGMFCEISNEWEEGGFAIMADSRGIHDLTIVSEHWAPLRWGEDTVTLELIMRGGKGRNEHWTLYDALLAPVGERDWATNFTFSDPSRFLAHFANHTDLDVLGPDGSVLFNFSLVGSARALAAFRECQERIR